jgi:TPR repeat protein
MYAEEMLGDSYRRGLGIVVDYQEALRLFKSSSSKGNPWAFNNLGEMYRYGFGIPKNANEAFKNFRIAAEKGNPAAQVNMADIYRLGETGEVNGDEAFQWALKATKQNYPSGFNQLGLLYRDGIGVRQDTLKAIEYFKKSIELKSPLVANCNLANIYFGGYNIPRDLNESAKYAEYGAKFNQVSCMNVLANILIIGNVQIPKDYKRAFELAQRSHELGYANGSNTLGFMYRDGLGVQVDYQMALNYFNQAVEKGSFNGLVSLGRMYFEGLGVPKDVAKADQYFKMAQVKMNNLGPATRTYLQNYLDNQNQTLATQTANEKKDSQKQNIQSSGPLTNQKLVNEASKPVLDKSQQELLDRLDKMQRQMEVLQASANTINANQSSEQFFVSAPRKALVVGNNKYSFVSPLQNATEDAKAIAGTLKSLGYTVSLYQDIDQKAFKKALRDFRGTLAGGDEVLFFFAGHGVQLGSANYLLPIDIRGDSEEQVKDEGIELQRVLDDMKSKDVKFSLAIIDACRDNPFKSSGRAIGGRGLAPTTAATGQMVMFSAGSGQQALDKLDNNDKDKNGLFTRVLLKEMVKPQIPVDRVLRTVRNEVVKLSKSVGHEQTPALYDQAVGDFYFKVK